MKKLTHKLLLLLSLTLLGCARGCQQMDRDFSSNRHYIIKVYSGPALVMVDTLQGVINQEEKTDGIYYYKGDTLKEVSGTYILTSVK